MVRGEVMHRTVTKITYSQLYSINIVKIRPGQRSKMIMDKFARKGMIRKSIVASETSLPYSDEVKRLGTCLPQKY